MPSWKAADLVIQVRAEGVRDGAALSERIAAELFERDPESQQHQGILTVARELGRIAADISAFADNNSEDKRPPLTVRWDGAPLLPAEDWRGVVVHGVTPGGQPVALHLNEEERAQLASQLGGAGPQ
ncbi:hypothetical protein [Streptomyces sp. NPDC059262]|uniref:hypothetical protein n=1 Tax=Streptomyces sp. NPDC059262 TaxID=3346797 RepID=UPI0036CFCA0B